MPNTTIYTVLLTGVDVDREFFPNPEVLGSYLSLERARKEMWRMVKEEDEIADSRYNGRDKWRRLLDDVSERRSFLPVYPCRGSDISAYRR